MSKEQVSVTELLLSLDSSELEEAEQVRAAFTNQLSTDRGGAVLSSLVDHYLDSSSSQALVLLSSIREPHHKLLLDKLTDGVNRPGTRVSSLTLLGHLIRKQPPWVHHISRSPLLLSLLKCLKTDGDVVVLITAVLVLVTLLPMIPQAGKQHIYDFFDVFGRLVSWSCRSHGQVPLVHLVHLHAAVYSLFHRLYGMFPCNFISYLRLHYSMKENLEAFQELVKPMLDHVRVHPELVTGTQDYELDPSRWRCHEVHDIIIECSRVSLDPLESSCEEDVSCSSPTPPPLSSSSLPVLDLTSGPHAADAVGSSGSHLTLPQLTFTASYAQADDITWSPSSQCGLSTPPPEPAATGSAPTLSRTASTSGGKCPAPSGESQDGGGTVNNNNQVKQQPITEEERGHSDVIISREAASSRPVLTSTPGRDPPSSLCFTPSLVSVATEDGGPAPSYEGLFELALPRAAALFIGRKTEEAQRRRDDADEGHASISPLEVLDQLIVHGHDAHERLSRRSSVVNRSLERSQCGGPSQGEELQGVRSQLLLIHSQLQYERFKRQQHAVRNRRLLRRVVNAAALEEHNVAMRAQLLVQDQEIRSLRLSLEEEQRRYTHLQQDTHTHTAELHTHIQQLLLQQLDQQRDAQRLQSELQECQSRLRELEAELQRANHKAHNADHQLTQLSLKLCSSEQLQQQMFLLNQQLVLLREVNRSLTEQLEGGGATTWTEASMLQCSVGNEYQRLRDSEVQLRQKLEAANHRTAELENLLTKKDQLILNQKKLLEDTKTQSRAELSACDSRCVGLRRIVQNLQTEMLNLYSQIHLDSRGSRPNGGSAALPVTQGSIRPRPSSSSVGIINGAVEVFSTSPLLLPSCSSSPLSLSPIESPLAVGSFLERRARQLFRPTNRSQEEEEEEQEEEPKEEEEEEEEPEEEEAQPESPPLGQEVEEATLLTGSLQPAAPAPSASRPPGPAPSADLTLAVRQRRHELSIMDYDETLPEY